MELINAAVVIGLSEDFEIYQSIYAGHPSPAFLDHRYTTRTVPTE